MSVRITAPVVLAVDPGSTCAYSVFTPCDVFDMEGTRPMRYRLARFGLFRSITTRDVETFYRSLAVGRGSSLVQSGGFVLAIEEQYVATHKQRRRRRKPKAGQVPGSQHQKKKDDESFGLSSKAVLALAKNRQRWEILAELYGLELAGPRQAPSSGSIVSYRPSDWQRVVLGAKGRVGRAARKRLAQDWCRAKWEGITVTVDEADSLCIGVHAVAKVCLARGRVATVVGGSALGVMMGDSADYPRRGERGKDRGR